MKHLKLFEKYKTFTIFEIRFELPIGINPNKTYNNINSEIIKRLQHDFPYLYSEDNRIGVGWGYGDEEEDDKYDDFNIGYRIEEENIPEYEKNISDVTNAVEHYLEDLRVIYKNLTVKIEEI